MMNNFKTTCFVCEEPVDPDCRVNLTLNLPVCKNCEGTEREKEKVQELLEGMADGFVCGCI
ncbi:hypothetical protein [Mangrovibacterium marinum]|nr:hypothetical protein [Mangrovibacterium marinum]